MRRSRSRDYRSDTRGQSELIGVVLVLSLTVIGATAIAATGASVLADSQSNSQVSQAENAMSQMSSKASLVALGESETQRFGLGGTGDGSVQVRPDQGRVRIYHESGDGVETILDERPLGAVVYRNGDDEVAYQGGGVWRRQGDYSRMVSPPEYHYNDETLTFPVVRVVDEEATSTGSIAGTIGRNDDGNASTLVYPDADRSLTNPVADGTVYVEIRSEYHHGWYEFFDSRSDGTITHRPDEELVIVDLTVPIEEEVETVLATTGGTITMNSNPNSPDPGPNFAEEGVSYASTDGTIDGRIDTCKRNTDECTELPVGTEETLTGGTYYSDGHVHSGEFDVDPNGGEVDIVVDGDFLVDSLDTTGDGTVNVFVRNNFQVKEDVNRGGEAKDVVVYVHSDGNVDLNGGFHVTGVVYAPGSTVNLNGGGGSGVNVKGGIIGERISVNGEPNDFEYDPSISEVELDVTGDADLNPIVYLHVTENEIEVRLD